MADRDGNSIAFTMNNVENHDETVRQYNATLFKRPMLRTDEGARAAANQDYAQHHGTSTGLTDLYFDVSGNGTLVAYTEKAGDITRVKLWDMLARKDAGRLFDAQVLKEPARSALLCGISSDGRFLLVQHNFAVQMHPDRPTLAYTKLGQTRQLTRYDRTNREFLYVGVAEEESASKNAECDYFTNGPTSRQMSRDGNRVAWDTGGHFYIRDVAGEKTIKIKQPSTIYEWTLSGDGRFIVFTSDKAPDGTVYKNQYGSNQQQIYRFGPIEESDFGTAFSLSSFEAKLLAN
jgi:hypothetical protein